MTIRRDRHNLESSVTNKEEMTIPEVTPQFGPDSVDPLVAFAIDVFGSSAKAYGWLSTPDSRHSDQAPSAMLGTPEGRAAVEQMLIQIDEGIFL